MNVEKLMREVRVLLCVFVSGLLLSGITAFPIHTELVYAHSLITLLEIDNPLVHWLEVVYHAVDDVGQRYPFIAYGTDWLAYAHVILAILFLGIIKDPIRNIWVVEFGLIACIGIFPLAFIAGEIRGVPFFWQLIDCSFGLFGGAILWMCYVRIRKLTWIGRVKTLESTVH
jgi:hypothetical protein